MFCHGQRAKRVSKYSPAFGSALPHKVFKVCYRKPEFINIMIGDGVLNIHDLVGQHPPGKGKDEKGSRDSCLIDNSK